MSSWFTCDSSRVVYVLGSKVCGKPYVTDNIMLYRARYIN